MAALSLHPQASYGVENAEYAVVQLAQTTMRSELGTTITTDCRGQLSFPPPPGKIKLDSVFQERMNLNNMIVGESSHDSHMTAVDSVWCRCHQPCGGGLGPALPQI